MRRTLAAAAVVLFLVGPRVSEAQVLTGNLSGTVRDAQGLAVPGAKVRLTSESIIGGAREVTSDEKGRYAFPALTPGQYEIAVTKSGFQTATSNDIQLKNGAEATLDFKLVAGLSETAQVTAARDGSNKGIGTHYGTRQLQQLPTPRNGMFAFVGLSPFISQTSRTTSFLSALGAGVDQNSYFIDATNVTAVSNSIARTEPGVDFAQDVRVQLLPTAEYGNVQGAVIEVIMRQGTDRFLWDGSLYGQPAALTSQPILRPINFTAGAPESGYERHHYANATTTLGGPIVRNRALFFAGYEYVRDEDSQPGADPGFPKRYRQHKAYGKVTWLLAPGWQLMQSVHFEAWDNRELPTATRLPEATQRVQATIPAITFGNLTHVSRANRVWEVSAGQYRWSQDITRSVGDPTVPGRMNLATGVSSGAPVQVGWLGHVRWTARATVSQYQTGFLGTDHQWKIGGTFDRGQHRNLAVIPTGRRYIDNPPAPARAIEARPSNASGRFNTASAFVTDEFRVGRRISIAAGVRFDYARAISPDIPELDANANETGKIIKGDGFVYSWQVFSPRISMAAQLTADGRTTARLSYGKFRQGVLTGEISLDHPGAASMTQGVVNPVTGEFVPGTIAVTDPTANIEIDHGTRAPTTDTYSVVIDRELAKPLTLSVAYVHKDGTNFIGWSDIKGEYRQEWRTTEHGTTIPTYVLTSGAASRYFMLANQPDYSLKYDGFTVMLEKRLSRGWYASGSYTLSAARGLQPSGGTSAAGAQVATTGAPPVSFQPIVTFGRDPNSLTNAGGRLPNDRPNLFRLTGSLDVPRTGIIVAGTFQHSTGKPWAATADITPSVAQGPTRVLLEERGTQRLSSQTVFDLRVSKAFSLGAAGSVDVRFDILNVLNDTAEEAIASDRFNASTYGRPTVFLDPRRVMLSVRMSLGK